MARPRRKLWYWLEVPGLWWSREHRTWTTLENLGALQDGVAARGAENVGGRDRHLVLGRPLALRLFVAGLGDRGFREQGSARAGERGDGEAAGARHFQEPAALFRQLIG